MRKSARRTIKDRKAEQLKNVRELTEEAPVRIRISRGQRELQLMRDEAQAEGFKHGYNRATESLHGEIQKLRQEVAAQKLKLLHDRNNVIASFSKTIYELGRASMTRRTDDECSFTHTKGDPNA